MPVAFTTEQKIRHLLKWASEWNDGAHGKSMWLYSLNLGGSHALMNGWLKSEKVTNSLSVEEKRLLDAARKRAADVKRRSGFSRREEASEKIQSHEKITQTTTSRHQRATLYTQTESACLPSR